jgi:uncharacterized protein with NRDE domain
MQGAQQTLALVLSSMCTIAILFDVVAGAPLVVAANRDEVYARPARPPESLGDRIVGGVDVLSGGTWLAIRGDGRFAAVTNQRVLTPPVPGLRSRGLAVKELAAAADQDAYVAALDPAKYASMNLVWGDARGVAIAYARRDDGSVGRPGGAGAAVDIERLPRGIHVLCNDRLGAEGFPRAGRLADAIARAPLRWPDIVPSLETALADHTRVEPPRSPLASRLSPELARELTATCIHAPGYGTRSSTIIAARPGETLAYLHADGPPCTAPFIDRTALL